MSCFLRRGLHDGLSVVDCFHGGRPLYLPFYSFFATIRPVLRFPLKHIYSTQIVRFPKGSSQALAWALCRALSW